MSYLPGGREVTSSFFWRTGPQILFLSHFLIVPHAAALAAMYVRWGGLPIGIGVGIAAISLSAMIIPTFRIGPDDPITFLIGFGNLAACGACHIAVYLRAESLASR